MTGLSMPSPQAIEEIVARAADPNRFARFMAQGEACGWCRFPIRLSGVVESIQSGTGIRRVRFSAVGDPDNHYLKACGTRRETLCPSCAHLYKGDARQIITAGLTGGKGVPESVSGHPAVFATLTAPGFGAVHSTREYDGRRQVCRAADGPSLCRHGSPIRCQAIHEKDDPVLGEPLCHECFDYEAAVLWNARATELWRRTIIYLRRILARLCDMTAKEFDRIVRVSFAKVAEYQRRGVIHIHCVIRLDAACDECRAPTLPLSAELLALAVRITATRVSVPLEGHAPIRWGEQVDVRVIAGSDEDALTRRAVANYIGKYSTKSSDPHGSLDHRLHSDIDIERRNIPEHFRRLCSAAWTLGDEPSFQDLKLRLWAHDLGYRGTALTKSQRWSTTFAALDAERRTWRTERSGDDPPLPDQIETAWEFEGRGWLTAGDAYLVESARLKRDNARLLARDDQCAEGIER